MSGTLQAAVVRVPGSTSNLGSGFDTIGLALDRHLVASFEPDASGGLRVERTGTLTRLASFPGPDLVAETFRTAVAATGVEASGSLRLHSTIPVIRGFGSSAAAMLAGIDLARAALGRERDDEAAFAAVYRAEGHGDNAAPCLYGGLRAVVPSRGGPKVIQLDLSEAVGFAYAAPAEALATAAARAALPYTVTHTKAVSALGRVTALVTGLARGDRSLIRIGVEDELHVPHRLPLILGGAEAVAAGYEAGAWGVTISGAGSGLLALCEPEAAAEVAAAMKDAFGGDRDDPERIGFAVRPDFLGLQRS